MNKKHDCPLCPKEYQSKNKLKDHCWSIHGANLKDLEKQEVISE